MTTSPHDETATTGPKRSVCEAARRMLDWLGQDDTDFDHTEDRDARHCAREVLRLHEPDVHLIERVAQAIGASYAPMVPWEHLGLHQILAFREQARAALAALREVQP